MSDALPPIGTRPWVGYCVRCGNERWMTADTKNDPCGICVWQEQNAIARPTIGVECPRCHFILRDEDTLDRTPRSSEYPCEPCLNDPPTEAPDA